VYSLNPTVTEMLTKQRVDDISRHTARCRRHQPSGAGLASGGELPRARKPRSVRRATGWALVEIGLRLAVPRRTLVTGGSALPGQRGARRNAAVRVAR
jgi:hypothetical protein